MKILVILQTMYSGDGADSKAPLLFRINPRNLSGKKMLHICDGHVTPENRYQATNEVWFSNVSSILSGGGAESIRPVDLDFVKRAIYAKKWDLIVFGGEHSKAVYKANFHTSIKHRVILMPHPASRNFTNNLKQEITDYIVSISKGYGTDCIEFKQLAEKKTQQNIIKRP